MQVHVLIGSCNAGTSLLQQILHQMEADGINAPTIQAGVYSNDSLLEILEVRIEGGQRQILVNGCTREQILAVLTWQTNLADSPQFEELQIHLIRRD
ncbi:hypothetical protein D3C77_198840 [compost metagenome]